MSWASAFTMNVRLADRYRVGRVFLVGDAAHTHPPTGGQGLNTSVQDAYNLGWKVAAVLAGASEALLETYEEERRPIAGGMLGLATELLEALKRGSMRRGREVQQLDLAYPGSSLALEMPDRTVGLRAGDRAPDAPVLGAAGQARRLFDLFQGPHWTMLVYMDRAPAGFSHHNLHIHVVGDRGDIVVVRPDGYVGAIVSWEERHALQPYLARVDPVGSTGFSSSS